MPESMIRRQIYLTPMETRILKAMAKATGLTMSDLIRRAIDTYIKSAAKPKAKP